MIMSCNYGKSEVFKGESINPETLTKEDLIFTINKAIGFTPILGDESASVLIIAPFDMADAIIRMSDDQLLSTATSETFYKPHSSNHEKVRVRKRFNYITIDNIFISLLSDNNIDKDTMIIMYNGI